MLDIIVPHWLDGGEVAERRSVNAELTNLRIARDCAAPSLPTAALRWDNHFVSGDTPGALTPTVARETLTTVANRRRWARQKAYRGGLSGLARALTASPSPAGRFSLPPV